jgi:hypothetical protein
MRVHWITNAVLVLLFHSLQWLLPHWVPDVDWEWPACCLVHRLRVEVLVSNRDNSEVYKIELQD